MYKIEVTESEMKSLHFGEDRGYTANLLSLASIQFNDHNGVYTIEFQTESDAWTWTEEIQNDPEAFLTCMGPSVCNKLNQLYDMIV